MDFPPGSLRVLEYNSERCCRMRLCQLLIGLHLQLTLDGGHFGIAESRPASNKPVFPHVSEQLRWDTPVSAVMSGICVAGAAAYWWAELGFPALIDGPAALVCGLCGCAVLRLSLAQGVHSTQSAGEGTDISITSLPSDGQW